MKSYRITFEPMGGAKSPFETRAALVNAPSPQAALSLATRAINAVALASQWTGWKVAAIEEGRAQ